MNLKNESFFCHDSYSFPVGVNPEPTQYMLYIKSKQNKHANKRNKVLKMPNESFLVAKLSDIDLGSAAPDAERVYYCTLAQEIILSRAQNVAIESTSYYRNESYRKTWDNLAQCHGLWVKFVENLAPDDDNYITIKVGF